jgi:hypothetical protein
MVANIEYCEHCDALLCIAMRWLVMRMPLAVFVWFASSVQAKLCSTATVPPQRWLQPKIPSPQLTSCCCVVIRMVAVCVMQRELVIAFFAYNAAQMVVSFHFFVDMVTDAGGALLL